jgi:hypothetical protein
MMKFLSLGVVFLIASGCSDDEAKREAAADAAFDAAFTYCINELQSGTNCDAYMEQNWQRFYREPN